MDLEKGETLWQRHLVLYKRSALILSAKDEADKRGALITYTVEPREKIFSLRRTKPYEACVFMAWRTEHPKLVVVQSNGRKFYFQKNTDSH